MSETRIMKDIQLELAKMGCRLFRNNVGMLKDHVGGIVRFGLCPGSSDLIGYMPHKGQAVFVAVEVKTFKGIVTTVQQRFIDAVNKAGGIAFVARSVEEAKDGLTAALGRGLS